MEWLPSFRDSLPILLGIIKLSQEVARWRADRGEAERMRAKTGRGLPARTKTSKKRHVRRKRRRRG